MNEQGRKKQIDSGKGFMGRTCLYCRAALGFSSKCSTCGSSNAFYFFRLPGGKYKPGAVFFGYLLFFTVLVGGSMYFAVLADISSPSHGIDPRAELRNQINREVFGEGQDEFGARMSSLYGRAAGRAQQAIGTASQEGITNEQVARMAEDFARRYGSEDEFMRDFALRMSRLLSDPSASDNTGRTMLYVAGRLAESTATDRRRAVSDVLKEMNFPENRLAEALDILDRPDIIERIEQELPPAPASE
ncbi:MAG: hypothetical protein NUW37_04510 [Planctomycetes bacterium]|nr:hypothetical protein [Planctomycetota bacterium]